MGAQELDVDMDRIEGREKGMPPDLGDGEPLSKMTEIIELLDSADGVDVQAVAKLIAIEIAYISRSTNSLYAKSATDRIKGLRDLLKTIQEGEEFGRKDTLNFDGPKFRYVLQEISRTIKASLKMAAIDTETTNHVLRIFRDQMGAREETLRKEVERITADSLSPLQTALPDSELLDSAASPTQG